MYRRAWTQRCLATTREAQRDAEKTMDAVQSACVDSGRRGPEWEAFIDTLPGYREHWAKLADECSAMITELFGPDVRK